MYEARAESKLPVDSGVAHGWSGLYDGLIPGYQDESCGSSAPSQPGYIVQIDVGAWSDPIMTRFAAFTIPAGGTFRYPRFDRGNYTDSDIVEAWADLDITNATHQIQIDTLEIVSDPIPPGAIGIHGLSGSRSWVISDSTTDNDTFDVSVALIAYYSDGEGDYYPVFIHSEAASADASTGSVKVNLAGAVKRYLETKNAASFYRWIILPPGSANVDVESDSPCDSLRQTFESSDSIAGLTGSADTLANDDPIYVWTGTAKSYLWTYDNISIGNIYVSTTAAELAAPALLQGDIIPVWPA